MLFFSYYIYLQLESMGEEWIYLFAQEMGVASHILIQLNMHMVDGHIHAEFDVSSSSSF